MSQYFAMPDDEGDDISPDDNDYESEEESMSMPSQGDLARDPSRAAFPESPVSSPMDRISSEMNDHDVQKIAPDDETARDFVEAMRAEGMAPNAMRTALEWHAQQVADDQAELEHIDADSYKTAMTELHGLWGPKTEGNIETVKNLFRDAPPGIFEAVSSARLGDGTPLGSDVQFLKWAYNLVQPQQQPQRTPYAPPSDTDARIKEIEQVMRESRGKYNRDVAMQQELLSLYSQREGG